MTRYFEARYFGVAALIGLLGMITLPAGADPGPVMTWSGDVDDTTIVYVHRHDVQTRTVSGKSAGNISTQVYGRLPEGPIHVFVTRWDGRGRVRVVQQPNPANDFTAAVRVYDPQPGRSHYDFTLGWAPLPRPDEDRDGGFRGGPRGYRVTPERFGNY